MYEDVNVRLRDACEAGNLSKIKETLKQNPYLVNEHLEEVGFPLLIYASLYNRVEIVTYLLQLAETNVNITDTDGDTALIKSSDRGQTKLVDLLLSHRDINVNIQNLEGNTALMKASQNGHLFVVQMLMFPKYKAILNLQNKQMKTAADLCCSGKNADRSLMQQILKLVRTIETETDSSSTNSNVPQIEIPEITTWNLGKVMVVGEGRAGKSALIRSLVGEPFNENLESTVGIEKVFCGMGAIFSSSNEALLNKCSEEISFAATAIVKDQRSKSTKTAINPLIKKNDLIRNHSKLPAENVKEKVIICDGIVKEKMEKYLNEDFTHLSSRFVLSFYDYGGQSIFNIIHPFFFTKNGLFLLVFNMKNLSSSSSQGEKEATLENLRFWFNSIALHSYDKDRKEIAPIILVGTRKDLITSPVEHENISVMLSGCFQHHLAWSFVIPNRHGQGKAGNTTFCFFPVDNTQGRKGDSALDDVIKMIENTLDHSFYMHQEIPLTWLRVVDEIINLKNVSSQNSIGYRETLKIASKFGMDASSMILLLKLMHETGVIMWHEEENLCESIILDPINYFVLPVSMILCNHKQTDEEKDATWHLLEAHLQSRRKFPDDWRIMLKCGFISNELLYSLLNNFPNKETVILLMQKYGLLLPFQEVNVSLGSSTAGYITPALLPSENASSTPQMTETKSSIPITTNHHETNTEEKRIITFYFGFHVFQSLNNRVTFMKEEFQKEGFLPRGFFERLICRVTITILEDSSSQLEVWKSSITKHSLSLSFKGQKFSMRCLLPDNLIEVKIDGYNPIPIWYLLFHQMQIICKECYESLQIVTLLPLPFTLFSHNYHPTLLAAEKKNDQMLINLLSIKQAVQENTNEPLLSVNELKKEFNTWLIEWRQQLQLSNYDLFLSYRWNPQDSAFVNELFQELTYSYQTSLNSFAPVSVFLDSQRLKDGEDFKDAFSFALSNSKIIVPIITVEALKRMIHHNPQQVDNLLLEWILTIYLQNNDFHCQQENEERRGRKVIPIVFGSYTTIHEDSSVIDQIFSIDDDHSFHYTMTLPSGQKETFHYKNVKILDLLFSKTSTIYPMKTLQKAEELLIKLSHSKQQPSLLHNIHELRNYSVADVLQKLLSLQGKFLSSSSKKEKLPQRVRDIAKMEAKQLMITLSTLYGKHDYLTKFKKQSSLSQEDKWFYNIYTDSNNDYIEEQPSSCLIIDSETIDPLFVKCENTLVSHELITIKLLFQEYKQKKDFTKMKELQKQINELSISLDSPNSSLTFRSKEEYHAHLQTLIEELKQSEGQLDERLNSMMSEELITLMEKCSEYQEKINQLFLAL